MAANFQGFWSRLCIANKSLVDPETKLSITAKSLQAQLEKAYHQGGRDYAQAKSDIESVGGSSSVDKLRKLFPWLNS